MIVEVSVVVDVSAALVVDVSAAVVVIVEPASTVIDPAVIFRALTLESFITVVLISIADGADCVELKTISVSCDE